MLWPHKAKAETSFRFESHSSTHRTSLASRYPKVTNAPSLSPLPAPASNDGVATHETRGLSCDRQDAIDATTSRSSSMKTLSQRSRMQTANTPVPAPTTGSGRPAPATPNWHDRRPRRGTGLPPHSASASRATLDLFRFQLLYRGGGTSGHRKRRKTALAIEDHIRSAAAGRPPQLAHHKNRPTAQMQASLAAEPPPDFRLGARPASGRSSGRPPSGPARPATPTQKLGATRPSRTEHSRRGAHRPRPRRRARPASHRRRRRVLLWAAVLVI